MPEMVSVRTIQMLLGASYLFPAFIAVAQSSQKIVLVIFVIIMMSSAYLTGKIVPDVYVPRGAVLRICGVALGVIAISVVVEAAGGSRSLEWVGIVTAYCAGNRLKAGDAIGSLR